MELKSKPGAFLPTGALTGPGSSGLWDGRLGAGPRATGRATIPQSSVVSKHFCFKVASPAEAGAELTGGKNVLFSF